MKQSIYLYSSEHRKPRLSWSSILFIGYSISEKLRFQERTKQMSFEIWESLEGIGYCTIDSGAICDFLVAPNLLKP